MGKFPEYLDASVSYSLASATVSLDQVFFPSLTICNMNTLRKSFILSLLRDPELQTLNVTYEELKKLIHLVFIEGEDYHLNDREKVIIESESWVRFPKIDEFVNGRKSLFGHS